MFHQVELTKSLVPGCFDHRVLLGRSEKMGHELLIERHHQQKTHQDHQHQFVHPKKQHLAEDFASQRFDYGSIPMKKYQ